MKAEASGVLETTIKRYFREVDKDGSIVGFEEFASW